LGRVHPLPPKPPIRLRDQRLSPRAAGELAASSLRRRGEGEEVICDERRLRRLQKTRALLAAAAHARETGAEKLRDRAGHGEPDALDPPGGSLRLPERPKRLVAGQLPARRGTE